MIKLVKPTVLALGLLASANVSAKEIVGTVKNINADGGIFKISVCTDGGTCEKFWLNTTDSDYNKSVFSLFLTAKATKGQVWVMGKENQPTEWPYYGALNLQL